MSILPYNEYLLVLTNGNAKGFDDLDELKAYVNVYYTQKVKNSEKAEELDDPTDSSEQLINTVCKILGVDEGSPEVFMIEDLIQKVQEEIPFDDEREEIISELLKKDIDFNTYDLGIDFLLHELDAVDIIEDYGER